MPIPAETEFPKLVSVNTRKAPQQPSTTLNAPRQTGWGVLRFRPASAFRTPVRPERAMPADRQHFQFVPINSIAAITLLPPLVRPSNTANEDCRGQTRSRPSRCDDGVCPSRTVHSNRNNYITGEIYTDSSDEKAGISTDPACEGQTLFRAERPQSLGVCPHCRTRGSMRS
jgi:hypothetical protein